MTEGVSAPDLKDAMVAIVGAGVALAGLLLIFSGFLFAQAAVLPPDTSDKYINSFKHRALVGLVPFTAALAVAAAGSLYWFVPSVCLAHDVIGGFIVLAVATGIYGIWAVRLL